MQEPRVDLTPLLVRDIGCEASLPEMAPPTFAEVDPAGVPAMSLPDGACQSFDRLRNSDEMHVIRHEAIRPDIHPVL